MPTPNKNTPCLSIIAAAAAAPWGAYAALRFTAPAPGPGRDFPGCPKECGSLALTAAAGGLGASYAVFYTLTKLQNWGRGAR